MRDFSARVCWVACALLTVVLLAGCGGSSSDATATPTASGATPSAAASPTSGGSQATPTAPTGTAAATATMAVGGTATATSAPQPVPPTATATSPVPTATSGSTPEATATTPEGGAEPDYLDDRSSPDQLLKSYYSAIDRREYLRAYSYWGSGTGAPQLPGYDEFAAGYAGTASVDLTLGEIRSDAGAGQIYYWVPVALDARQSDGSEQFFAGCYKLHLGNPAIQAEPPFQPLAVSDATVDDVTSAAEAEDQLATACDEAGGPPGQAFPTATASPTGAEAAVYLDDRSTPEQVLRSYYNAVNRKEYARAYGYWEAEAEGLAPFGDFAAGYAETDSVELTLGTTSPGAAAGNLYWDLPAVLVATLSDGSTQTFAGCYRLHLGQPTVQGTPPFQPLALQSAEVEQVDNGADAAGLLASACAP